ncbi:hypothetical protein N7E70_007270 [Aminobacter sp. NyZ550]|uniref:hypothetical protein n=1 Tax=Aminobacter sp. NyZ550 TaxID=2979870 RepID=UPI0021D60EFF|nr:hypothetical protein [Aminobacter sp. NyZ550]WAX96653.1 hypothetical protein N7E70_007270 [Aminobacter sp. NyZ550]
MLIPETPTTLRALFVAAYSMMAATASGFETAWLPAVSVTVAPARSGVMRCAAGGIMRSSGAPR